MEEKIFIARGGDRFGPYSREQCMQMLARGQVGSGDLACREGMAEWHSLSSVLGYPPVAIPAAPVQPAISAAAVTAAEDDGTVGQLLGQMGCGCLVWIGVLALAIGGGVVFPFLLVLLPIALIGGLIDMVRKIIRIAKRRSG